MAPATAGTGMIRRVAKTGGAVLTVFSNPIPLPFLGAAVDATHVYYGESQKLTRIPKAGGVPVNLAMGSSVKPTSITLDATNCYWTEAITGGQGGVFSIPLAGGMVSTLTVTGGINTHWLSKDAGTLYWTSLLVPRIHYSMPLAGGTVSVIDANSDSNIAHDATSLYFARKDATFGTRIIRRPKAGGTEETLGKGGTLGAVLFIGVANGAVFYVDTGAANAAGTGRVLRL
jgi:hypothetical protein